MSQEPTHNYEWQGPRPPRPIAVPITATVTPELERATVRFLQARENKLITERGLQGALDESHSPVLAADLIASLTTRGLLVPARSSSGWNVWHLPAAIAGYDPKPEAECWLQQLTAQIEANKNPE